MRGQNLKSTGFRRVQVWGLGGAVELSSNGRVARLYNLREP